MSHSVLYTGVTNDIARRVDRHKNGEIEGFTKRYKVKKLVHVEVFPRGLEGIAREKQIKGGPRQDKTDLID